MTTVHRSLIPAAAILLTLAVVAAVVFREPAEAQESSQRQQEFPKELSGVELLPAKIVDADDEETRLLKERYNLALDGLQLEKSLLEAGFVSLAEIQGCIKNVAESKLDLAKTPAERVAAWEQMLKLQTNIEEFLKPRLEEGIVNRSDLTRAAYGRVTAQLSLLRAKKQMAAATPSRGRTTPAPPTKIEAADSEETRLLKERYNAALDGWQLEVRFMEEGKGSPDRLRDFIDSLTESKLDLAKSAAERVAVLEQMVTILKGREKFAEDRVTGGIVSRVEVAQSKYARLTAQLNLLRAKKQMAAATPPRGRTAPAPPTKIEAADGEETRLLKERYNAALDGWQLVFSLGDSGKVPYDRLPDAINRLTESKLDLAKTPAERVAVLEQMVTILKGLEKYAEDRFMDGITPRSDVAQVAYARVTVQLNLLRAKKQMAAATPPRGRTAPAPRRG